MKEISDQGTQNNAKFSIHFGDGDWALFRCLSEEIYSIHLLADM